MIINKEIVVINYNFYATCKVASRNTLNFNDIART